MNLGSAGGVKKKCACMTNLKTFKRRQMDEGRERESRKE